MNRILQLGEVIIISHNGSKILNSIFVDEGNLLESHVTITAIKILNKNYTSKQKEIMLIKFLSPWNSADHGILNTTCGPYIFPLL